MANFTDYNFLKSAIADGHAALTPEHAKTTEDGYSLPTLLKKNECLQSEHLYQAALDVIQEASKEYKTSHDPEAMEKMVRAYNVLHRVKRQPAKGIFAFFKNLKAERELNAAMKRAEKTFTKDFAHFVEAKSVNFHHEAKLEAAIYTHVEHIEKSLKKFNIPTEDWKELKLALAQDRRPDAHRIWNNILAEIRVQTDGQFKTTKEVEKFLFDDVSKTPALDSITHDLLTRSKPLQAVQEYFISNPDDFNRLRSLLPLSIEDEKSIHTSTPKASDKEIAAKIRQDLKNNISKFLEGLNEAAKKEIRNEISKLKPDELNRLQYVLSYNTTYKDLEILAQHSPLTIVRNPETFKRHFPQGANFNLVRDWLKEVGPNHYLPGLQELEKLTKHTPPLPQKREPVALDADDSDWAVVEAEQPKTSILHEAREELVHQILQENKDKLNDPETLKQLFTSDKARLLGPELISLIKLENIRHLNIERLSETQITALTPEQADRLEDKQWEDLASINYKGMTPEAFARQHFELLDIKLNPKHILGYIKEHGLSQDHAAQLFPQLQHLNMHEVPRETLDQIYRHVIASLSPEKAEEFLANIDHYAMNRFQKPENVYRYLILSLPGQKGATDRIQREADTMKASTHPAQNLTRMLTLIYNTHKSLHNNPQARGINNILSETKEGGMFKIFYDSLSRLVLLNKDDKALAELEKLENKVSKHLEKTPDDADLISLKEAIIALKVAVV
ncbi:MAG: hypothetical protein WC222_04200 [Parachlamydiales bacterium]|jgi:hypothetical protein